MIKISTRSVKVAADYYLHIIEASDIIGKLHKNWFDDSGGFGVAAILDHCGARGCCRVTF